MFFSPAKGGGKQLKPCKDRFVRNPKTNRCVNSSNITGSLRVKKVRTKKSKTLPPCPDGQVRRPGSRRCQDVSLTDEQREEFDKMLHVMRQPVMKRNGAMGEPEPCDVQACLTSASVSMLKAEMNRRGYKVASPVVNVLMPRKKGEPRPT